MISSAYIYKLKENIIEKKEDIHSKEGFLLIKETYHSPISLIRLPIKGNYNTTDTNNIHIANRKVTETHLRLSILFLSNVGSEKQNNSIKKTILISIHLEEYSLKIIFYLFSKSSSVKIPKEYPIDYRKLYAATPYNIIIER